MNVFNFLFEQSYTRAKDFVIGSHLNITFKNLKEKCDKLSERLRSQIGENNQIVILSENSIFQITA